MKIFQICSHYVPAYHYGGALHVTHSLSEALIFLGHEVHVCTTNLKDPYVNLDVAVDIPVDVDGVTVYYEPVSLSRYWGFSSAMVRRIWTEVKWADIVLIHFHYQFASLIGGWISRLRTKPYIIFSHGSLNRYGIALRSMMRKRLYLRLFEHRNFRKASFVAYHSPEELGNSIQPGRSQVVPNGIFPNAFAALPKKGYFRERYPELKRKIVFLYLGRLDAGKGLDILLPAFRCLLNVQNEVHLVLAGGNERGYDKVIHDMISKLDMEDHVTLTGLISGQVKLGALQDLDVYVLPSRSEGMSIAMIEAMYMGLPVVVSDRVGLCSQIVEVDAGLVAPLEVDKLANALIRMAESSERWEIGKRGRQLIESQYTWNKIACNLMEQIQELM